MKWMKGIKILRAGVMAHDFCGTSVKLKMIARQRESP